MSCLALAAAVGAFSIGPVRATHGGTHVTLEPDTKGCTGVLPSADGNTDMRLVGGTLYPGGTAVFEITYPVNAASVGKQFTILDCAFINDVATLRYTVTFVPSNQSFVLSLTLAVPVNAPVGGLYCNYVKTTGSPTAAQGSQRKAGPACFIIPPPPTVAAPPAAPGATPTTTGTTAVPGAPLAPRLPDTSTIVSADQPTAVTVVFGASLALLIVAAGWRLHSFRRQAPRTVAVRRR